ncbi:MAG: GGDEF domain-containing protein [Oscillospiraceae bacterium]|jgi:diguanylate cyclase (GGDEF)-like protein|nr:GGDEF domain-containing protein [Oscillospiraceae bacterium]
MNDNPEKKSNERDGIRLSRFHLITAVLFVILAVLLLLSTYFTKRGYSLMQEATERYITAQQAAANIQAASDYLTSQARAFIATGDVKRCELFFEETDVTRRRDHALEEIEKFIDGPSIFDYLSAAMNYSNELLEIERYAMRLGAESYGYALSECPEQLSTAQLEQSDLLLSPEEQRDKALTMVFDDTYQGYKDNIRENIALSTEALISETREQQTESSAKLLRLLRQQDVLIIVMLLLALLLVVMTFLLISRPLQKYIRRIRQDETLPEEGALELRFFARTYNQVREQNRRHRDQLNYDATHDALTGVFNRSVFEKLRSRFEGRDNALLIIDVDKFKSINDLNGHDVGDKALCLVASLLQENFRAEDYICRIGGDEFAVIMVRANSSMRELVDEKFRQINEILRTPQDGLPSFSLSVGVAFGDRENSTGDIFKDADTALYRTKSVRQGGCEFY